MLRRAGVPLPPLPKDFVRPNEIEKFTSIRYKTYSLNHRKAFLRQPFPTLIPQRPIFRGHQVTPITNEPIPRRPAPKPKQGPITYKLNVISNKRLQRDYIFAAV